VHWLTRWFVGRDELIKLGLSDPSDGLGEGGPQPKPVRLASDEIIQSILEQEFNPNHGRYGNAADRQGIYGVIQPKLAAGVSLWTAFRDALESGNITVEQWKPAVTHFSRALDLHASLDKPKG
jgi:hypothetical protein